MKREHISRASNIIDNLASLNRHLAELPEAAKSGRLSICIRQLRGGIPEFDPVPIGWRMTAEEEAALADALEELAMRRLTYMRDKLEAELAELGVGKE